MSGEIEYGVVSFCPDLTDPNARSVPVAVIGLHRNEEYGEEDVGAIFMIARADIEGALSVDDDHLSRAILNDLPDFLSEQIQEGLRVAGSGGLIPWIEHTLRNSLHVSEIVSWDAEVEIDDYTALMNRVAQIIGEVFDEQIPEEPFDSVPGRSPSPMGLPNMQFWDPSSLENKGTARNRLMQP